MPASIGVNLRVTGHCSQGGRKYMEDLFSVAYQQTEDERDLEYAFFGIYDGHGGGEAAAFAKEHLMDSIVKQRQFWSDNDEDVLKAIRNGYMLTHLNMWKEVEKWPKTVTGLPSTAGTTASVAFIRRGKIYIGHVGDSAIVLGYQKDGCDDWAAKPLTLDHKPESTAEIERIQRCGGKVISKAGVPRVVWNRPRPGHKGPIKKNTPMDEIPFLAVARSLGDLWSYNPQNDEFIVSPDPDVGVLTIDPTKFRCLIFGTDGLWNMISPEGAVSLVQVTEKHNEAALVGGGGSQPRDWLNPSKSLVDHALERWSNTRMRADNTSVVTLMLDPPGPPRATVLRSRTTAQKPQSLIPSTATASNVGVPPPSAKVEEPKTDAAAESDTRQVPQNGLTIMTRYSDVDKPVPSTEDSERTVPLPPCATLDGRFSVGHREENVREDDTNVETEAISNYGNPAESYFMARLLNRSRIVNTLCDVFAEIVNSQALRSNLESHAGSPPAATVVPEAAGGDTRVVLPPPTAPPEPGVEPGAAGDADDGRIQINEVSSSSPTDAPPRPRARRHHRAEPPPTPAPALPPPPAHHRVLRSHHDAEAPQRPRTRLTTTRARPAPDAHHDRVVILTRRGPATPAPAPAPPPAPTAGEEDARRATRSQMAAARAHATAAGNSPRAPGPPHRARRAGSAEVHSTTGEGAGGGASERALRSRNEAAAPAPRACKRAREEVAGAERCSRALGKRAAFPWAPALALRNRLRRRLVK